MHAITKQTRAKANLIAQVKARVAAAVASGIKHKPNPKYSKRTQLVTKVYGWNEILDLEIAETGLSSRKGLNQLYKLHFEV